MVPRDIGGQDPEPVASTTAVQRRVDPKASGQHEPDIPTQLTDRAPHTLCHSNLHPQITHPRRRIRHIPGGPAGQHRGHGHHIGLLTGPLAVGDDAADRVPAGRPCQLVVVVVVSDVPGDLIQAGGARCQVHLVQQLLELAQGRRPSHARPPQRPRPLRTLLRARPDAPDIATHRTIVSDPLPRHGTNSANSRAR